MKKSPNKQNHLTQRRKDAEAKKENDAVIYFESLRLSVSERDDLFFHTVNGVGQKATEALCPLKYSERMSVSRIALTVILEYRLPFARPASLLVGHGNHLVQQRSVFRTAEQAQTLCRDTGG